MRRFREWLSDRVFDLALWLTPIDVDNAPMFHDPEWEALLETIFNNDEYNAAEAKHMERMDDFYAQTHR